MTTIIGKINNLNTIEASYEESCLKKNFSLDTFDIQKNLPIDSSSIIIASINNNELAKNLSPLILEDIKKDVETLSIFNIKLADISNLCADTENAFTQVLDDFLTKIEDIDNSKITDIVKTLICYAFVFSINLCRSFRYCICI